MLGLLNRVEVELFESLFFDPTVERSTLLDMLEMIYDLIEPELHSIADGYKGFLNGLIKKKEKKQARIILSIKSLASLQSKVIDRKKNLSRIKDLVRATILLGDDEAVAKLYKDIVRKKKEVIRYAQKERGGDSLFGYYGSYHIIFYYRGLHVELQLMTRKLWSYKAVAHELYEKYRDQQSPNMDKFDYHTCKMLFARGNQPKHHYKRKEVRRNYKQLGRYF